MGLHDALTPSSLMVWRFYNAHLMRQGRAHLLRVPLVKREIIHAPNWYYRQTDIDRYIERAESLGDVYLFPGLVYEGAPIERYCNVRQQATRWAITEWYSDYWRWESPVRGVCNTCLNFAQSTNRATLDGPAAEQITALRAINETANLKEWTRFEQGHR